MATIAALAAPARAGATTPDCHVGAYRLTDGTVVDVAPSDSATLRWRRLDGTTGALTRSDGGRWVSTSGWTGRPDGIQVTFGHCATGDMRFGALRGQRIRFDVTETRFVSRGTALAGRLVLPRRGGRVPLVVLVHGAERSSALDLYALQRMLPAEGVGAFVYDKRGTGASAGQYTQDFDVLADDAVAAMREARRIAGGRAGRVGYQGGSQGGWVAPIAASRAPVDFVIVSFGLAVSVIDEDQEATALEMRLKGHGPEEIAKALEVAAAAEAVFESGFTGGFEQLDAVRAKYGKEPWYKDVHGNFTHLILSMSTAEMKEKGAAFRFGTPFRYDPMPTLAALTVPQLWVLGGADLDAPSGETSRRLKGLIADGRPITLALYPQAEHGMTEFETTPDGRRVSTRYAAGYFAMLRDFARAGRLASSYGSSVITRPAR
ncbi:MAG: serine aminopeptidase domain-containing protein [Gemmatimonadaceae bacterium]